MKTSLILTNSRFNHIPSLQTVQLQPRRHPISFSDLKPPAFLGSTPSQERRATGSLHAHA
ncbi:hypothetical protein YC2023_121330 [Brassica napus]